MKARQSCKKFKKKKNLSCSSYALNGKCYECYIYTQQTAEMKATKRADFALSELTLNHYPLRDVAVYNKNPCAWLLWHWSSVFTRSVGALQPTRPLGRVGSKFNWPSEDQCQRSHSKWVFVFIPHLKIKYSQLIVSKLSRKSAICLWRSPWRLIVLCSLRFARLDTAWLVKSVTYFNLIG